MNDVLYQYISELVGSENILQNEPMKDHTTFRIGGEAECLLKVPGQDEMIELMKCFHKLETPYYVIGNGSNILVGDKGISGIVLSTSEHMNRISIDGERITVEAGEMLSRVAAVARDQGLSGLEFAAGIPGTIGGAIVMNAGAYDGEMKQIVECVRVVSAEGEVLELDNETMEFGYRTSIIKNRPFIVLEAVLKLRRAGKEEIKAKMDDFTAKRREKQPLEYPSAGSTFKRPEGNFAGRLIMDAGLRGFRVGGAQVSEKHCGFVINVGGATAADVVEVMEEVKEQVKDRFNVELEPEIILLGEF
ncbi:MAG: UDP-N-acetylmuramate dehydrogenase [Lachnospiraceae bacterium]|jgi:UDP-N-acetylmuramate dehydrogenase|nr:UDP-N-acetylmuramate dehydrogenase [Lachnospiraceae bacterium]